MVQCRPIQVHKIEAGQMAVGNLPRNLYKCCVWLKLKLGQWSNGSYEQSRQ